MAILNVIILLAAVLGLAYFSVPVFVWTITLGVVLLGVTYFGKLNLLFLLVCWLIYVFAAAYANLNSLRKNYITKPLIQKLQKRMPPISETEREAIESGNVWWEKELFCGKPEWKKLHEIPQPKLSIEEQAFLDNQVETLCNMLDDWKIVRDDGDLTKESWDYLKSERFFGMVIPKEYGGLGFSALAHSTIVIKIATRSMSAAVNAMVPNSLGPGELLVHYGTKEQKEYYLPRLAAGEEIPCFALTGPEAGSDAGAITDKGIVCRGEYQGKKVIGIRLTWDKRYITLAPVATLLGLAFRLYDPEHLLGDQVELGITLCLVPTTLPGIDIGNRHLPMYMSFMNGPTRGKDVFVPIDAIIGGISQAGKGWKMLMECLSIGRSISLPALSTACGKYAYRLSGAYARVRRQFNVPIAYFEGIEEALGYIAGYTYILEACRIMTAGAVDLGVKPAIASAIAKYHMAEMARKAIAHAMDIHAGHAIQVGPHNLIAHAHIAIPVSITVEGANILTRNLIIYGQGAIRCHPYLLQEVNLLSAEQNADTVAKLDKLLLSHIGYTISNLARTFWCGLTSALFVFSPVRGPTAKYYRQISRMSSALAFLSDIYLLMLGGNLKRKERVSARLGDILSQLYLATSVLKYFRDNGQPATDLDYVRWCIDSCLNQAQVACDGLLDNFPVKWLGKLMRRIIFPWGGSYYKPSDQLHHNIVNSMLTPSDLRSRLTNNVYISKNVSDPSYQLEEAFKLVPRIEPLLKKYQIALRNGKFDRSLSYENQLQAAINAKILTEEEATALYQYDLLYKDVIKVDEFSFDLSTVKTKKLGMEYDGIKKHYTT